MSEQQVSEEVQVKVREITDKALSDLRDVGFVATVIFINDATFGMGTSMEPNMAVQVLHHAFLQASQEEPQEVAVANDAE